MKINVIVHPNAKTEKVEKDLLETLHIYVNKPPLEGKANNAAIELLSKYFNVKKNCVLLISGHKSKNKVFEILR